jgi:type III secretion protein Q
MLSSLAQASRAKIVLRPVASELARLRRRVGAGLVWQSAGAGPWRQFELVTAGVTAGVTAAGASHTVLHGAPGMLHLEGYTLLQLGSGIALDADWPAAVLQDMARLAWASLDPELRQALGGDAECRAAATDMALTDGVNLLLTLVSRDGDERHSVSVRATAATALRWLDRQRWRSHPGASVPPALAALPCPGQLWLGGARLAASALRALRTGDAIRIAAPYADADGNARIRLGAQYLNISAAPDGAVYFLSWGVPSMSHDVTELFTDDDAANDALDALQIKLDFTAGHSVMSLEQLRTLAVGSVIELAMPARPTVDILANGRRIGSGELIDVAGELAVEIVSMQRAV